MIGKAKTRQMKPKRAAKKRERLLRDFSKGMTKVAAKAKKPKPELERFVLLVTPLSKVTVKRDLPWWPMTNGVCDPVTVRIEIDADGDVIVDGWTSGIDKSFSVPKKYLRSAEGGWCDVQGLARRNWHFVHAPSF